MESLNKISQIELTNNCTGKCAWCPYNKMARKKGFIEISLVEKIAKKISYIQDFVYLHFFGESTLHPELDKITEILKNNGIDSGIYTNSKNLTEEIFEKLINSNLKEIHITLDRKADFDGILSFVEGLDSDVKLFLIKIDLPEIFDDRISTSDFYRFANSVKSIKENTFPRVSKFEDSNDNDGKPHCCRIQCDGTCDLWNNNEYIILWDGRITTCLKDHNGKMCIGTIDDFDELKYKTNRCPFVK